MTERVLVICVGSFAAIDCEPRQARKGATVTVDSGAEILLAQVAAKFKNNQCLIKY